VAKKAGTTRVHQIAKELGVTSKDIVKKCEDEGIPSVTNHMSTLSAGLAATIREWFADSGSAASTAVQTAAPVDVDKARKKAKKKARKKPVKSEAPPAPEVAAPTPDAVPPVPPTAETAETAETAGDIAPPSQAAPAATTTPDAAEQDPKPAEQRTDEKEADVAPRGRRLEQPVKTKLAGPKVIRVETPDVVPKPRSSKGDGPRGPRPGGPRPGGGPGMMPPGPPPGDDRRSSSRRNKRRSASARQDTARPTTGRTNQQDAGRQFNWRQQDLLERERRLSRAGGFFKAARRDNLKRTAGGTGSRAPSALDSGDPIVVAAPVTIKALSAATGIKGRDIVRHLVKAEHDVDINSVLETELAVETMADFGVDLQVTEAKSSEEEIASGFEDRTMHDEQSRAPVVTILGHVDHGKTSLLDRIRSENVAEGEAGGITQATSAFRVPVRIGEEQREVTFIDTPGHEAFTEMRARGAQVTDIVVLVVAADDGVMPQTVESINHAKAAGVPIVIALNKVDKAEATDANIQRIFGQLTEHELNPVEWGGDTEVIRTSAIEDIGITDLLEVLDYQAQLLDLSADFGGPAEGTVLESRMEDGRGAVITGLVQQGQLSKGDCIVVGRSFGRVRDIVNDRGERNADAMPSTPVAVSGINTLPDAGDKFYVVKNLRTAESAAQERIQAERERDLAKEKVTLDNIFEKLEGASRKELPIILKSDCQGSAETIKASLEKCSTDEVTIAVKHSSVGGVNDSDVALAQASGAIVIGFNVTASGSVRKSAEKQGVDVRFYEVIYDITDDVEKAILGLLDPVQRLEILGHAEVREAFKISKVGMVAGCYVTEGSIERNALIRVTRDEIVIESDRKLAQLKRFKDDAKEVKSGQECGMLIDGYDDIKVGDVLECYKVHHEQPGA
tara:strand:+ start:82579 stop:85287 length:2709 start_codon:yes stop_codon:yes gene_type:complete